MDDEDPLFAAPVTYLINLTKGDTNSAFHCIHIRSAAYYKSSDGRQSQAPSAYIQDPLHSFMLRLITSLIMAYHKSTLPLAINKSFL